MNSTLCRQALNAANAVVLTLASVSAQPAQAALEHQPIQLTKSFWTIYQVQGTSRVVLEAFDLKYSAWVLLMSDDNRALNPMRLPQAYKPFVTIFGATEIGGILQFQARPEVVISTSGDTVLVTKTAGITCWRVLPGGVIAPWLHAQRASSDSSNYSIHVLQRNKQAKPVSVIVERFVDPASASSLTCDALNRLAETPITLPPGSEFIASATY